MQRVEPERNNILKYNTVIFDFDGTLADTEEDVWISLEYAASKIGCHFLDSYRTNRANLGASEEDIFCALQPKPSYDLYDSFWKDVREHYRSHNKFIHTRLFPGIENFLQQCLVHNIPCYIVTLKPLSALENILYSKGWNIYFHAWLSVDSFSESATKTQLLAFLLEKEPRLFKCVYVGDTYSDVTAARANGIDCIGVTYGDGDVKRLEQEEPVMLVSTSNQLIKVLSEQIFSID